MNGIQWHVTRTDLRTPCWILVIPDSHEEFGVGAS